SNAGTSRSNANAFAPVPRCASTTRAASWTPTSSTTTRGACTVPLATSHPRTNSKGGNKLSSLNATANSKPHAHNARRHGTSAMVYWPTPGETAAGSAGEQPDQGIARLGSSRRCATGWGEQLTPHPNIHHIGSIDPPCLKKLPPEGRNYLLTKSGHSPLPAEPRQYHRAFPTAS